MGVIREFSKSDRPIKYIFAVDPGTGSSSACGVAFIEKESGRVLWTASIYAKDNQPQKSMKARHRIKLILEQVMPLYEHAVDFAKDQDSDVLVAVEAFVIKGKGGVTLEHMKGAFYAALPLKAEIVEVQNTVVKKVAGGKGTASKEQIGKFLQELIPDSSSYIQELINKEKWDEIDAVGIAYSSRTSGRLL